MIIGFLAGGGYDPYSRPIGLSRSKCIPGNPVVVLGTMALAGSLIPAHHTLNAAPEDDILPVDPLFGEEMHRPVVE